MRPQELFIDVVSGRFLDGLSAIPISAPKIYANEEKTILINLRQVRNNVVTAYPHDPNSRYDFRIGTPTLKLAESADVSTAPPALFNAIATAVTASPTSAVGRAKAIFTSVTTGLTFLAKTSGINTAKPEFRSRIDIVNTGVTATITVSITTATILVPTTTKSVPVNPSFAQTYYAGGIPGTINSLRALVVTATLNTPQAATFLATVSGGTVMTISIVGKGSGYPAGTFALGFSGGSPTTTASAEATISGGIVDSISITTGGSGYGSAPSVTMFTPEKGILELNPTNYIGLVNGKKRFYWGEGVTPGTTAQVPIRFSALDAISTTAPLTAASAFCVHVKEDQWEINLVDSGYGYVNVPTVTHDTAVMGSPSIKLTNGGITIVRNKTMNVGNGGHAQSFYSSEVGVYDFFTNDDPQLEALFNINFDDIYDTIRPYSAQERALLKDTIARNNSIGLQWNIGADVNLDSIFYVTRPRPPAPGRPLIPIGDPTNYHGLFGLLPLYGKIEDYTRLSNTEFFVAARDTINTTTGREAGVQCPLFKITVPTVGNDFVYALDEVNKTIKKTTVPVGGIFNLTWEQIDAGNLGNKLSRFSGAASIKPLSTAPFTESAIKLNATVLTADPFWSSERKFLPTVFSSVPSVITTPGQESIAYRLDSPGFGFVEPAGVKITQASVISGGAIRKVTATTVPKGYAIGDYDYTVPTPPGGTAGKIQLQIRPNNNRIVILDSGNGYTTPPVCTPPDPNVSGVGKVVAIIPIAGYQQQKPFNSEKYVYDQYDFDVDYPLEIEQSPTGLSAIGSFRFIRATTQYTFKRNPFPIPVGGRVLPNLNEGTWIPVPNSTTPKLPSGCYRIFANAHGNLITNGNDEQTFLGKSNEPSIREYIYVVPQISEGGLGYLSAPSISTPTPPRVSGGNILVIGRSPEITEALRNRFYRPGSYALDIPESPIPGGTAKVNMIIPEFSAGTICISIISPGFGYATDFTITAPPLSFENGTIIFVSPPQNFGKGYRPGVYDVTVPCPPSGTTPTIIYNVPEDQNERPSFIIVDGGSGYTTTAPITITAAAATGAYIDSISITCQGNYYTPEIASVEIFDSFGSGAILGAPVISAGRITNIPVLQGGYGYSDSPTVQIGETVWPGPTPIDLAQVQGVVTISAASANAILTTANERNVTLEIFEVSEDGTRDQVVVQGTMVLAKRVLE